MQISPVGTFNNVINFCGRMVNTVYFNDSHANTRNIDAFLNARDSFYCENQSEVNLTLCGGDMFLDKSIANKIVASKLRSTVDAYATGNHDLEGGDSFANNIKNNFSIGKWLAANLIFTKETPISDMIMKSTVIEKKGERIGIIGAAPLDLTQVMFLTPENNFIQAETLEKTILSIREEVKKLEEEGINKIMLIAHTGEKTAEGIDIYKELAKIGGIDVILGGHDHKQVDRWELTEREEPVKIVSTGRNGNNKFKGNLNMFGILRLYFDDNGILDPALSENRFEDTAKYKNPDTKNCNIPVLGKLRHPVICDNPLREENKVANIVADSNLWYVNAHTTGEKADFAIVNPGTIRGNFETNSITEEIVAEVVPFTTQTLIKTKLTKKQIIDALTIGAKSCKTSKASPGLLQVSGLRYNIDKDYNVSNVKIVNPDGSVKYDLNFEDDNKEFTCVYDTFLATGPEDLISLKKDIENGGAEVFAEATRQLALCEYFKENENILNYGKPRILMVNP